MSMPTSNSNVNPNSICTTVSFAFVKLLFTLQRSNYENIGTIFQFGSRMHCDDGKYYLAAQPKYRRWWPIKRKLPKTQAIYFHFESFATNWNCFGAGCRRGADETLKNRPFPKWSYLCRTTHDAIRAEYAKYMHTHTSQMTFRYEALSFRHFFLPPWTKPFCTIAVAWSHILHFVQSFMA